ncbi:hypothetical protein CH35J_010573 [Colletotrichum higginsianum]|uniref:Uncharacterized protein n=1 Tax=Colletotrichum higginsianum TaxID=80884 RepID=A0A4T0VKP9_9PEZI|nr:hypothetical protein CH35J_010573 [Colletotrichum higginsianum]
MQFANILLAALAGAASVSARTNPTARRQAGAAAHPGCRIVPASDLNFGVADLTSGTVVTKVLTFPVGPSAAGPCQLVGAFARGFPIDQGGGALARLDVRALGGDAPGSLVGSFGPLQVEDDVVVRDTLQVINSFQCAESLSFEFEVANDAGVEEDINVTFTASALGGFFVQVGDQCN